MNVNKIIISGNLVKDMEVITLKNGVIGNITIANNRGYGEYEKTNFVRCSIFGEKRVEGLQEYLVTGTGVLVTGELDITTKENDGDYNTFTNIKVDEIEIDRFKNKDEDDKKSNKKNKYKK